MQRLQLTRFAYTNDGAVGAISLPDGKHLYTIERPWLNNQRNVSCIPEGEYVLRMRESGVVSRSSGGKYSRGWEVTSVPNRSFIMIHPGNTMLDLEGCISPGLNLAVIKGKIAVTSSRAAFDRLMGALDPAQEYTLTVSSYDSSAA